ncbi:hypothetical protein TIFTF001_033135 [Ficus carica]|uniref:Uncharacterized protein n=1 Tax=Ficus carica TaxID=3494 RepID=A0AA88J3C3_FICCA|nr:hypothetical protein TIFTF001_033135 [Ficus carica]
MKCVHMARKRGERIEVTFDEKGQLEGKHGDELISWIGVLAREHVPIWIQDWRSRDLDGLKEIIWKETVTSFTVDDCFRSTCLKSCGEATRYFRHDLYKTFVEDFVTEDSVWTRPQKVIDNYPNIKEDDWFKKNGKWEKRDGLWLDSWTDSDGELKDLACKKVRELIVEYNTQESQGTFESVGTSDVLTQALSRPEHPGRIREQSKFVKQSQYFNLNRSSNRDNEVQSMRREIEELKALVRGLCVNKDVEPSFDQENVPTVDQHNNFKASCSVQEKQHGVSDPPIMPVSSQECKLFIFDELHGGQLLVAFGRAWLESLPIDTVHGIPLDAQQQEALFDFNKMNMEMRPLAYYAHSSMRQGNQIDVPIPYTIMSFDMPVFLSVDDIYEFINLPEISSNCIIVYIRYLEELCRINRQAEKFVFVSPTLISPGRTDTEDAGMRELADSLVGFLRDASK